MTVSIFAVSIALEPEWCKELMEEYNQRAKFVWKHKEQEVTERK